MRRLVLSIIGLAALAGTAVAQQPPAASPPPPPPAGDRAPPPSGPDASASGDRARPLPHGPDGDMAFHAHRPPPPPPSKAAHFRIEDGDAKVDIKCADDEPMKVCSEIVLQGLDRLTGQSQH
jgi:hypothetical protein